MTPVQTPGAGLAGVLAALVPLADRLLIRSPRCPSPSAPGGHGPGMPRCGLDMKVLLPYLIGAATTFVVQFLIQFYVVPRVQTRKQVQERWVKDVLDLGELLTTSLQTLATEAWKAQLSFRILKNVAIGPEYDQAKVEQGLRERKLAAFQVTQAFTDFVAYRVVWVADRIIATCVNADQIVEFFRLSYLHRMKVLDFGSSVYEDLAEEEFDALWASERKLRAEMTNAVKALTYLSRPPRASWRWRFRSLRRKIVGRFTRPESPASLQAAASSPPSSS
jgi:hypothetical protein